MTPPAPEDVSFPSNWDRLKDRPPLEHGEQHRDLPPRQPPILGLVAAAWGDLVAILAVCTAALVALVAVGHRATLQCLPWAVALALIWWAAAAAVLVTVRRSTPGMLMAGLVFEDTVPPRRLLAVLATAVVLLATVGVLGLLGPRRSPLARAAGRRLRSSGDLA